MTKTQELLNAIKALIEAAKAFNEKGDNESYQKTMQEIAEKKEAYELAKQAEETEKFLAAEEAEKAEPIKAEPGKGSRARKGNKRKGTCKSSKSGLC